VGTSALSGAVSSGVSAGVSVGMSGFLANSFSALNSTPALKAGVKEAVAGSVGEFFGAFAGSLVVPGTFEQANSEMLNAAKWGAISGFTIGFMTEGIKQLSLGTTNKQKSNNSIETQLENQLSSERNAYYRNEYIQLNIDYKVDMYFTPSFSTDFYEYYITPTTDPNKMKILNPENPFK